MRPLMERLEFGPFIRFFASISFDAYGFSRPLSALFGAAEYR